MFSKYFCLQIVVGFQTPSKPSSQGLIPILLPELMDSRATRTCSEDDVFKSNSHVQQLKESRELLPGVHNATTTSSPVSSYRSMFETWEEQRRKLYQYTSSEIEVIVKRKNGLIEKLHNRNKNNLKKNCTDQTLDKIDSNFSTTILDKEYLTRENEKNFTDSIASSSRDDKDLGRLLNDKGYVVSEELNVVPLESEMPNQQQSSSPYQEIMTNSTKTPCKEAMASSKENVTKLASIYTDTTEIMNKDKECDHTYNKEPNCNFIFNIKTRFTNARFLDCKDNLSKTKLNLTQTQCFPKSTEEKAIQVDELHADQNFENEQIITHRDCASQCIGLFAGQHVTISTQTDVTKVRAVNIGIQTDELEQLIHVEHGTLSTQTDEIQRLFANSGIQTDEPDQKIAVKLNTMFTQTDGIHVHSVDFGIQTEEPKKLVTSASTQFDKLMVQLNTFTKECQADHKVPCCNVTSQTVSKPIRESSCQAVSEMNSKASQTQLVGEKVQTSDKAIETITPGPVEVQDVGVQLTASCCYFARKRERKRYHNRLQQFFPQHFEKDKSNDGNIEDKLSEAETSLSDSLNSITLGREEVIELVKNCQSIRSELEEVEIAQENGIATLVTNATQRLERRNLESLEEDDLFLS